MKKVSLKEIVETVYKDTGNVPNFNNLVSSIVMDTIKMGISRGVDYYSVMDFRPLHTFKEIGMAIVDEGAIFLETIEGRQQHNEMMKEGEV